ncbi:hypothetical protein QC764_201320 [Podospora pseudoanserina]|uniref:Fork-head domain-containing protein n=1 Tax=Podospora pseudoanserina TaxID=2609844 RepID=A0ABR0IFK4_9PEZI|nr:hypothetical protein QC764_201320 [Podospora pseudoanserina]
MNSSVMDSNQPAQPKNAAMSANAPLDLDAQSPPRPPFSPLTEAATDSGTREPSVNPGATLDQDEQQDQNASASATADTNPSLSSALVNSNSSSNFNSNSSNSNLSHLNVSQINGASAMDNVTMDMGFDAGMDMYGQGITPATNILMAIARSYTQTQQQQQHQHQQQHQRRQSQLPSTIHPAQVSRTHSALDVPDALMAIPEPSRAPPPVEPRLESFARIEFADSVFQMTTYAVVIGRDVRALELARKQEKEDEAWRQIVDQYARQGLPPPPRPELNRRKFTRSYVSEEGGMLGPESEDEEYVRPAKRRRVSVANSASGDSSMAQHEAAMAAEQAALNDKSLAANRQYVWHTPGSASVNLNALRPSPYTVPFIGIHSPGPDIAKKTKGISRQHLRIEYDQNEGVFKAYPLHRNGIFIDDKFHKDEGVTLRSGNRIQIKEVEFKFIINGVAEGKTGAEEEPQQEAQAAVNRRYSEGGKEMSFDFESSHDAEKGSTSPEEVPVEAAKESSESELSDLDEEMPDAGEPEDAEGEEDQEVMETIEQDAEEQLSHIKPEDMTPEMLAALPLLPPKKRGPGRPPKNGIMSKREERLRKKAAMELAKKNMPPPTPGEPPIKRKVGRPRKHPLPENTPDRPEKRKYKPRKSKNGEEGEMSETEKTLEKRRREKPKTPPLELNRADYTEEQLQKPNKNYGILIDEVLSAAPPDGLTLKQIYKRIQMKYPFYYFTVDTKGWESSVRHNLIGNVAFKKNEETHLWARVPGIDIDAGKKRKAASPDHSTSIHSFGQHYQPTAAPQVQLFHSEAGAQQGYRPGAGPPPRPGYPASQSQMNLGQHPHQQLSAQPVGVGAQQALHQPYQSTAQGNSIPQMADQGAAQGSRPIPANSQATAYSSPYASRPPPSASPQAGNVPQSAQRQQLPHQNGAAPHNGVPQPNNASPHPASAAGVKPGQPISTSGTPAPIKPSIHPRLVEIIRNFRKTVTSIGAIRSNVGDAGEAIAMSVINRGLGLASQSTTPTFESIEKIVLNVFESQTAKQLVGFEIAPKLIERLVSFKRQMINTLKDKMKPLEAEQLVLSAIDRVLGFADKSIMQGTDAQKTSYELAEGVLMPAVQREIAAHDKEAAAASMPPTPTPAPSQVRTPAQMPAPGKHPSTPHSTAAHQSAAAARPGSVPAAQTPVQMQNQPPRPVYSPAQQAHMAQQQPRATVGQPAPAGTSNGNPINAQYMNQNAVSGSGAGPAGTRPIDQVAPAPQSQVAPAPVAQGDAPARSQASAGSATSSNQNRPQSHGMPVQAYPHLQAAQAQYRTQALTQSQQQNPAAAQQPNQQPRVQPGQAQQAPSYSVQNQQPQQQAQNQQAAQQIQNRPPQSPAPTPARIQGQSHPVHARPAQGGQSPLQVQSQIQGQVQGQVQAQSQGQKPVPGQGQAQSQAPNQQTPVQQTQGQYQPRPQVAVSAQQVQQHAQQPSPQQAQQQALQQTQQHAQQQPRTQPTQAQPVQAYQTQAQQARVQQQSTPQQTARQQPVQHQPIQQVAQPSVQPSLIQQAHVQQPQAQHAQASPAQAQQPPTQQIQAQQPLVQQAYAQSSYARPTTPAQAAQMSRAQARPQVQPQGPVQAPSQASGASPAPSPAQKPVPGPAQVSAPRVPSPTTQAQPSQAVVPSIQNAAPLQNQMPAQTQASAQQPLSTTQSQPSKPWGPAVPSPPAAQSNKPSPQLSSQAAPSAASKVSIPAPTVTAPSASPSPIQRLAPTPGMIPLPPKPPAPVATPPPQASAASADSVSSAAPASSSAAAYIPPPPTPTPPAT